MTTAYEVFTAYIKALNQSVENHHPSDEAWNLVPMEERKLLFRCGHLEAMVLGLLLELDEKQLESYMKMMTKGFEKKQ